jgi:hypothetical protein
VNNGDALYALTGVGSAAELRAALRHVSPEHAQALLRLRRKDEPWDAAVRAVLRGGVEFLDVWLDACGAFDVTPLLAFLLRGGTPREGWALDDAQRAHLAKRLPHTASWAEVIALAAHFGDVPALTRYIDSLVPASAAESDSDDDEEERYWERLAAFTKRLGWFREIMREEGLRAAAE